MNRDEAISYLQRKGKIRNATKIVREEVVSVPKVKKIKEWVDPKFNKGEEALIASVTRQGKIYGDPVARIRW